MSEAAGRGRHVGQSPPYDRDWEAAGKRWQLPFVCGDLQYSEGGFKHILLRIYRPPARTAVYPDTLRQENMEKSGSVDSLGSKRSSSRQPSVDSLSR